MGRKPKQIYTSTPNDNKVIREWLDTHQNIDEDTSDLWFKIMEFYFDWIFHTPRLTDSVYHNSIYNILQAIGKKPQTDKEKEQEKQKNEVKQKTNR